MQQTFYNDNMSKEDIQQMRQMMIDKETNALH